MTRRSTRKATEAAVASAATSTVARRSQRLKTKKGDEEDPLFNELMAASSNEDKDPDFCCPPEDVQPCSPEAAIGAILDGLVDSAVRSGHKGLKKKQREARAEAKAAKEEAKAEAKLARQEARKAQEDAKVIQSTVAALVKQAIELSEDPVVLMETSGDV